MHQRIKELAIQSGAWNQVYNNKQFMVDRTFNVEKFAELIVRECVDICNDTNDASYLNGVIAGRKIKQHFGVEDV